MRACHECPRDWNRNHLSNHFWLAEDVPIDEGLKTFEFCALPWGRILLLRPMKQVSKQWLKFFASILALR
jgi:hypothetical protein